MRMVLLTQTDGSAVGVNPAQVAHVSADDHGTRIVFEQGVRLWVAEDVSETLDELDHGLAN